jgi:hypothetical protein
MTGSPQRSQSWLAQSDKSASHPDDRIHDPDNATAPAPLSRSENRPTATTSNGALRHLLPRIRDLPYGAK